MNQTITSDVKDNTSGEDDKSIKRGWEQSRTQSNACARARMALALGKLNFSCAVIGLTCMPTKPEPLNLGVPVVNFPRSSQCHPSPCTGIALGTRLGWECMRVGNHMIWVNCS